jgi:hypothetical protein
VSTYRFVLAHREGDHHHVRSSAERGSRYDPASPEGRIRRIAGDIERAREVPVAIGPPVPLDRTVSRDLYASERSAQPSRVHRADALIRPSPS